jgi:hypothetical protein
MTAVRLSMDVALKETGSQCLFSERATTIQVTESSGAEKKVIVVLHIS